MRFLGTIIISFALATNAFAAPFVQDDGNLLSLSDRSNLSQQLAAVQARTGTFVHARTVQSLNGQTVNEVAGNVRRQLEQDYPAVVVMLVSWNDRKAFIGTSAAARQNLSDGFIEQVFSGTMAPALKRQDIAGAFTGSMNQISGRLPATTIARGPDVVTSQPYQPAPQSYSPLQTPTVRTQTNDNFAGFLFVLFLFAVGVGILGYVIIRNKKRREEKYSRTSTTSFDSDDIYTPPVTSYTTRHTPRYADDYTAHRTNNVFAPIIVDNSTTEVKPGSTGPKPPLSHDSYLPQGGGAGGSFDAPKVDAGGGAGGSFDAPSGAGGSFDSPPSSDWGSSSSSWSDSGSGGSFDSGGSGGDFGGGDCGGGGGGDF